MTEAEALKQVGEILEEGLGLITGSEMEYFIIAAPKDEERITSLLGFGTIPRERVKDLMNLLLEDDKNA